MIWYHYLYTYTHTYMHASMKKRRKHIFNTKIIYDPNVSKKKKKDYILFERYIDICGSKLNYHVYVYMSYVAITRSCWQLQPPKTNIEIDPSRYTNLTSTLAIYSKLIN